MIFIVYLLFSNETILEGMKKGKKKLKIGKKGGLKMRAKKGKKAVEDAVEDVVEGGEDAVEGAEDAQEALPKLDELPRMMNDFTIKHDKLSKRVDDLSITVGGLAEDKEQVSSLSLSEEP